MDASSQKKSADGLESVCIRVFNDQPSAEIAAASLEANDIVCWTSADNCGGLMPIMGGGGVKLFVSADKAQTAAEVLSFESGKNETAPHAKDPPHDSPKFIIVVGVWVIYGAGLVGNLFSFQALYFSSLYGLPRFLCFWLLAGLTWLCAFMLYRSVKNYLVQRVRSRERQPD